MNTPKAAVTALTLVALLPALASAAPQAGGLIEAAAAEVALLSVAGTLLIALLAWLLLRRAR
jgi:hypothetical protein